MVSHHVYYIYIAAHKRNQAVERQIVRLVRFEWLHPNKAATDANTAAESSLVKIIANWYYLPIETRHISAHKFASKVCYTPLSFLIRLYVCIFVSLFCMHYRAVLLCSFRILFHRALGTQYDPRIIDATNYELCLTVSLHYFI